MQRYSNLHFGLLFILPSSDEASFSVLFISYSELFLFCYFTYYTPGFSVLMATDRGFDYHDIK